MRRDLNQLRTLKLDHGRLTDKGLRVLKNLTALRSLSLQYCNSITNKGLKAGMLPLSRHSLAQVDVKGCRLINSVSTLTDLAALTSMHSDPQCEHSALCTGVAGYVASLSSRREHIAAMLSS